MSDIDREARTPRLTGEWSIHQDLAHRYSERLRAHAAVRTIDATRSRLLRDLSDACEGYARSFARWGNTDVPTVRKIRERHAFSLLMQAIDVELDGG